MNNPFDHFGPTSNLKVEKIYKYRAINQYSFDIIDKNILKFSHPSEFNDPFDCDFSTICFDETDKIDPLVQRDMDIIHELFSGRLKVGDPLMNKSFESSVEGKLRFSSICSFSTSPDIPLLWSHYADSHKGMCLEFNNSTHSMFVNEDFKADLEGNVDYDDYASVNYLEGKIKAMQRLFATKNKTWSYEQEYRILINKPGGCYKYKPELLTAIYFGLKTSITDVNAIIHKCWDKGLTPLFFQMGKDNHNLYSRITMVR